MAIDPKVLAQIAASAYRHVSDFNRITAPSGWTQIATYPASGPSDDPVTGFSAAAYRGPAGEIVIAYAGTNVDSLLDDDWVKANLPAALGWYSPQVAQAAEFYWEVLNLPDVGQANKSRITFTGHSLGGGLASLMATYFDLPATTFDSAPFELSAFVGSALDQYAEKFAAAGITDTSWQQYRAAQAAQTLPQLFAQREANVAHVFVTNEALAALRLRYSAIVGAEAPLDSGAANAHASGKQLHSMLLAWAMLSNTAFAAEIRKLPRLFALMDDQQLFARTRSTRDQDFFSLLLKLEQSTGMLTQFTNDVKDVSDRFSAASTTISDALLALTMAHYYRMTNGYDAQLGDAVKNIAGGLEIAIDGMDWQGRGFGRTYELLRDMVDLLSAGGADIARGWDKERLVVSDGTALNFADTSGKRDLVLGGTADDTIVLGGDDDYVSGLGGVDALDGGAGDDILDAGADDDVLIGGTEDDRLQGGVGSDDYYFAAGDGGDVIIDADGLGRILLGTVDDAVQLAGGKRFPGIDNYWLSDPINGVRYGLTRVANGAGGFDLVITKGTSPDRITIRDWQQGRLGITLDDTPATLPPPAVTLTGDFNKAVDVNDPTQYVFDAQGNYVADGTQPNAADLITGTAASELIQGLGGDDALLGRAGDDVVEGGPGNDVLMGGIGMDRLNGGDGNDIVYGSSNGALTYPANTDFTPPAQAHPFLLARGFNWIHEADAPDMEGDLPRTRYLTNNIDRDTQPDDAGNLIDGGPGMDTIYAGTGPDLVHGGDDSDQLVGMAGGDVLLGGGGNDRVYGDGWLNDPTALTYTAPEQQGSDVLDGGDGDDILVGEGADDEIYGGIGADQLYGDGGDESITPASVHGRDYLDGGDGADALLGGGTDDELFGGSGDDQLWGDAGAVDVANPLYIDPSAQGDDYLDGEDGNDYLQGEGGNDTLFGGAGDDGLIGDDDQSRLPGAAQGKDYLDGEDGNDQLRGQGGADTLFGGTGADILEGDAADSAVSGQYHGDDYLDGEDGDDVLIGHGGDDTLFGAQGIDQLRGDAATLDLPGQYHGSDYLDGGADGDSLWGDGGADTLFGGDGADYLDGDDDVANVAAEFHGNDYLDGGDGNDQIFGGGGDDTLYGGAGDDWLAGEDEHTSVAGSTLTGNDYLDGGAGNDTLVGGNGDDILIGGEGNNALVGGAGDDTYVIGSGVNLISDTGGIDRIALAADTSSSDPAATQVWSGGAAGAGDNYLVLDLADGGSVQIKDGFKQTIEEYSLADGRVISHTQLLANTTVSLHIDGGAGADQLLGGSGNDTLNGGGGGDVLTGGRGNDVLTGTGAGQTFVFNHGDGRDIVAANATTNDAPATLRFGDGVMPTDLRFAIDGTDLLIRYAADDSDTVRVRNYLPGGVSFGIEFGNGATLTHAQVLELAAVRTATAADDVLLLGADADTVDALGGNDIVAGMQGDDVIDGGAGNDTLYGGVGADRLLGGAGDDIAFGDSDNVSSAARQDNDTLEGGAGNDTLTGQGGADTLQGDDGDDTLIGDSLDAALPGALHGNDQIRGGLGRDMLIGAGGADVLDGGDGNDVLYGDSPANDLDAQWQGADQLQGGTGVDALFGGGGNDRLDGGADDDVLSGEDGDDELNGGNGNDLLQGGAGNDVYIMDANSGQDTIRDASGNNTLRFGAGITPEAVTVTGVYVEGKQVLTLSAGGSLVNIEAPQAGTISSVQFGNGTAWSQAQLFDRMSSASFTGFDGADDMVGSSATDTMRGLGGDDVLRGEAGDDSLFGGSGADRLYGGTGDDVLDGGGGNDLLEGGAGADTYLFGPGSGGDVVGDDGGQIRLYAFALASDLRFQLNGSDLELSLLGRDRLLVRDYVTNKANWTLRLPDGQVIALSSLADAPPTPVAPPCGDDELKADFQVRLEQLWLARQLAQGQALTVGAGGTLSSVDQVETDFGKTTTRTTYRFRIDSISADTDEIWIPGPQIERVETLVSSTTTTRAVTTRDVSFAPQWQFIPVSEMSPGPIEGNFTWVYGPDKLPSGGQVPIGILKESAPAETVTYRQTNVDYTEEQIAVEETRVITAVSAGAGDNLIAFESGSIVDAGAGNDYIVNASERSNGDGFPGPNFRAPSLLIGGPGDDSVSGGAGDDTLSGGSGNDVLEGGLGTDTYIVCGGGHDVIGDADVLPRVLLGYGEAAILWDGRTDAQIHDAARSMSPTTTDVVLMPDVVRASDLTVTRSTRVVAAPSADVELRQSGFMYYVNEAQKIDVSAALSMELPVLVLRWGTDDEIALALPTSDMPAGYGVERIEFADGTSLTRAQLEAMAPPLAADEADPVARDNVLEGVTTAFGGAGNDTITGTKQGDLLIGGEGDDLIDGGDGNDVLIGSKGHDELRGGAGDDGLGTAGGWTAGLEITGPAYAEAAIEGLSGGNTYVGGTGNDWIYATWDSDVFVFDQGDGVDLIYHETATWNDPYGSRPSDWSIGDEHFAQPTPHWSSTAHETTWDYAFNELPADLQARLKQAHLFNGEYADDHGRLQPMPIKGLDTLRLGPGITSVTSSRNYSDLVLDFGGGDAAVFVNFFGRAQAIQPDGTLTESDMPNVLGRIEFFDGTVRTVNPDGTLGTGDSGAGPSVAAPIDFVSATEDEPLSYVVPDSTFANASGATFSATRADGSALPRWLIFDPVTRTFSGVPLNEDVGDVAVRITVTDSQARSAGEDFMLTVSNTNDAPTLAQPIADQRADEDSAFSFTLPAAAFADEDAGDRLSYAASQTNGSALPAWLTFDTVMRTFSGSPANSDVGSFDVRVTATDLAGATADATFRITVANVNDAPTIAVPLPDLSTQEREAFSWTVPADRFVDIDAGDTLRFAVSGAAGAPLPAWLTYDAGGRVLSGTPGEDAVAAVTIRVTATDDSGESVADEFVLDVLPKPGIVLGGTAGANLLTGTDGADTIRGADGTDVLSGGAGQDMLYGDAGSDAVDGGSGNDALFGGDGNDALSGGAGVDTMSGGAGSDVYVVDDGRDVVIEDAASGADSIAATVSYTLPDNVESLALLGTGSIDATGNAAGNILTGNAASNRLDGAGGSDILIGAGGDDVYIVDTAADIVTELPGGGFDTVESTVTLTLAAQVESLILKGGSAINGTGNALSNYLRGNSANNTLNGGGGNDVLQGLAGDDTVTDTSGKNALDGGDGTDALTGGTGKEFIAGGAGNDTLTLGGGADIVAFNAGHGMDAINAPTSGKGLNETNDTLSVGGVRYADLRLARSGNDLYVKVAGATDAVRFVNWYSAAGNRTTTTLQMVVDSTADYDGASTDQLVNKRVVRLNFTTLVNAFNTVYGGNPSIGDWAIPTATMDSAFIAGSDTQALGGDLAYRYGRDGNFSALDYATATAVLGNASFATAAQTFSADPTTGGVRLLSVGTANTATAQSASLLSTAGRAIPMADTSAEEIQKYVEQWAADVSATQDGVSYLTLSALSVEDSAPAEAPSATRSGGAVDLGNTQSMSPADQLDDVIPPSAADSMWRQWRAVEASLARLDGSRRAILGGETFEARPSFDELIDFDRVALATASRDFRRDGRLGN